MNERDIVELEALRAYKRALDVNVTASLLALSGEVCKPITERECIASIKRAFREAETEYQKAMRRPAEDDREKQVD